MQPNNGTGEVTSQIVQSESIIAPLFKVTSVSKYLALGLFIALPFIGGVVGYAIAFMPVVEVPISSTSQIGSNKVVDETSVDSAMKRSVALPVPENTYLKSARTEIMKGYYTKKVIPHDEVIGNMSEEETITCDAFVITEGDVSALYTTDAQGELVSLTQNQLPYTILIPAEATWPMMWTELLPKSSPTNQLYAAVTDIVTKGGKGLDTCEPTIEHFVPFVAN